MPSWPPRWLPSRSERRAPAGCQPQCLLAALPAGCMQGHGLAGGLLQSCCSCGVRMRQLLAAGLLVPAASPSGALLKTAL